MMPKNQKVAPLLRANFRTVFLNAEEKREIFFAGKTFRYKSGINELAKQLALNNGRISYPTISILNHKNEIIYQYDGYLSAQAMYYTLKKVGRPAN
jgi:thioredoxin-related protein